MFIARRNSKFFEIFFTIYRTRFIIYNRPLSNAIRKGIFLNVF